MKEKKINTMFIILLALLGICCIIGVMTGHTFHFIGLIFCCLMVWAIVRQQQLEDGCLTQEDASEISDVIMHTTWSDEEPHCVHVDLSDGRFAVVVYSVIRNYDTGDNDIFIVRAILNNGRCIYDITDNVRQLINR